MTPDLTQRANDAFGPLAVEIARLPDEPNERSRRIATIRRLLRRVCRAAAAADILRDALLDLRARFAERAEADAPDTEGYRPNEAMQIVTAIDAALERAGMEVPK